MTATKRGRPKKTPPPPVPQGVPAPPATLPAEAHAIWYASAADLVQRGIFAAVDVYALESFCLASHLARKAQQEVNKSGVNIKTPQGIRQNPACRTAKECTQQVLQLGMAMGLFAAARKRIGAASGAVDEKDEILDRSV